MGHEHDEGHLNGNNPLKLPLIIVVTFMFAEVIGGLLSHSLALIGDAGHMLVDALALGLSLYAMNMAKRPATLTRTYGYHRVEILAALANGITIGLVSFYIFYEAYQRFLTPHAVKTPLMLLVAILGLIANLVMIFLLRKESHGSLNIRSAFWHVFGDTINSVGVIVAAILISITGWNIIDPIIATFFGCIILWGAVRLVRESVDILSEAAPKHIQLSEVIEAIKSVPGVREVHDVHIWTITSGVNAFSAHLLIEDRMVSQNSEIVNAVNRILSERFDLAHSTLQLECEKCESCPSGIVCEINNLKDRV